MDMSALCQEATGLSLVVVQFSSHYYYGWRKRAFTALSRGVFQGVVVLYSLLLRVFFTLLDHDCVT